MTRVLIAIWLLTSAANVGVVRAQEKESKKIEGWGIVVNPDGDCTIGKYLLKADRPCDGVDVDPGELGLRRIY